MSKRTHDAQQRDIEIERTYRASIEDLWALWTTKAGFESWWGPEGFDTKVVALDPRPGGELRYAMTATGSDEVDFMHRESLPVSTEVRGTFADVVPMRRLVLVQSMDFIPGVPAYDMAALVELHATGSSVKMTLTIDAAHDEEWTERSRSGWESQLRRVPMALAARAARRPAGTRRASPQKPRRLRRAANL